MQDSRLYLSDSNPVSSFKRKWSSLLSLARTKEDAFRMIRLKYFRIHFFKSLVSVSTSEGSIDVLSSVFKHIILSGVSETSNVCVKHHFPFSIALCASAPAKGRADRCSVCVSTFYFPGRRSLPLSVFSTIS
jgi:hypothetical protein